MDSPLKSIKSHVNALQEVGLLMHDSVIGALTWCYAMHASVPTG